MPFRFDRSTCVAVGTFNMYIIQPQWLGEQGIIPKGLKVAISSRLDEPGFRFSVPEMRTQWTVTPAAIEVSTRHPDVDCGSFLARVLEHLPWTPLKAVGCNTFFKAARDAAPEIRVATDRLLPRVPAGFASVQRSVHVGVRVDEHVINVQLAEVEDGVDLDINVHTDIGRRAKELAQTAMQKFLEHRRAAERLIEATFNLSVTYGNPDRFPDADPVRQPAG